MMNAKLVSFGEIEIDGKHFNHDVVIEKGAVRKRLKKPSKAYRDRYGHTPLSADEEIPWQGQRLYIGTGMFGALPVMPEVFAEAEQRGVEVVIDKSEVICRLLEECRPSDINAILHVTC
jgi:hypothetical protein